MKLLFTAAALFASFTANAEYKASDRAALVRQLEDSRQGLALVLEGMTAEQSNFKPDSKIWSPTEVVEHLVLMEDLLMGMLKETMEKTKPIPDAQKLPDPSAMDASILKSVPDRSQKAQAPEQAKPKGNYRHWEEAFNAFSERRLKTVDFVNKTKADLRRYQLQTPMGTMDAHQWLLLLAAHTDRHIAQIHEAKSHELFPKSN